MENPLFCIFLFFGVIQCSTKEELLLQDPSLWPGHLEPFGSKQKTVEVDVVHEWPNPINFFSEYVDENKPVLFKGLAKRSPAFQLFEDEYLKSFDGADKEMVYAEPEKKENRTKKGSDISFKEFIERYHTESLYMVNPLPKKLTKDILMPTPLACEETRELMSSQVTWFSSGGTKSVVHNDDVDNINCLYRGTKELLFIEYNRNKKFVPIDQPQGGYSSIDVDKVNYTKYPMLRHVDEYVHARMDPGDCLFIPYHWFHQVNSVANEKGQNLAVNVWFKHIHGHRPKDCKLSATDASLDKFVFFDDEKRGDQDEEGGEGPSYLERFEQYLPSTKKNAANFRIFTELIKRDGTLNQQRHKMKDTPEDFKLLVHEIFDLLDVNKDGVLRENDFDKLRDDENEEKMMHLEESFAKSTARIEDYFEDLAEQSYQDAGEDGSKDSSNKDKSKIEL